MEMDNRMKIVLIMVTALGLLSAALCFTAEATKIKPSQITSSSSNPCVFPTSVAFPLGIVAAIALFIANIMIYCATGCAVRRHGSCLLGALCLLIISVVTFVYAISKMVASALMDSGHMFRTNDSHCHTVKAGAFTITACVALANIICSLVYYIRLNSSSV